MNDIVITSGKDFTDIDGLACCIAYSELLKLQGKPSIVVLPGTCNQSIVTVNIDELEIHDVYEGKEYDLILLDISDPKYVAHFLDVDHITEVYDHRAGFEDYWNDRIAERAVIEKVGAAATLIWEKIQVEGYVSKMSDLSLRLLAMAIVSNTLNFKASTTTQRDIDSFEQIVQKSDFNDGWIEEYFTYQQNDVLENVYDSIINDTGVYEINGNSMVIGQMELWNSDEFIHTYTKDIKKALESFNNPVWFMTSPSIREGVNYLYCENTALQTLLEKILSVRFQGDFATTPKLWLRKEILRELQKPSNKGLLN